MDKPTKSRHGSQAIITRTKAIEEKNPSCLENGPSNRLDRAANRLAATLVIAVTIAFVIVFSLNFFSIRGMMFTAVSPRRGAEWQEVNTRHVVERNMLTLIAVWALATFLAWLFVYGAGRATESNSLERARHDATIEPTANREKI